MTTIRLVSRAPRFVEIAQLSLRDRALFWLTNAPFLVVAAHAVHEAHGAAGALCAATACLVAFASTLYHGTVLFGGALLRDAKRHHSWSERLLSADMLVVRLTTVIGLGVAGVRAAAILLPLPLLTLANAALARGHVRLYAVLHGLWHIGAAATMAHLLPDHPDSTLKL